MRLMTAAVAVGRVIRLGNASTEEAAAARLVVMQGGEEERSPTKWKNGLISHGVRGNRRTVEDRACYRGEPGAEPPAR